MKLTLPKILTRKYLVIPVAALLLYALAGFVALPALVRWYVPRYAQQDLHCQAALQKVRINPFLLTVEINEFSLKQADGSPLIAFARLFVDLETSSLFRWAVVLRELDLESRISTWPLSPTVRSISKNWPRHHRLRRSRQSPMPNPCGSSCRE